MIKNPAIICLVIFFIASCNKQDVAPEAKISTRSELESYKPAPMFSFLSYVDREDVQKHRVRVVHQSVKKTLESESGIYYTYYFNENGRLEASSPGHAPTTYYNFFDANGRQAYTAWADEYGAPIENKKKLDTAAFMPWEAGKMQSSHKVEVFNTCYSVNAQYLYHTSVATSGGLPKGGRFEYIRERVIEDVPDDFLPKSPDELFAEFRYEFYGD